MKKEQDLYLGFLIGLVVGDALGTTLELKSPGFFKPIKNMVQGLGVTHLPKVN